MKEKYSKPISSTDEFNTVEVISTSFTDIKPDDNIVDGGDGWE